MKRTALVISALSLAATLTAGQCLAISDCFYSGVNFSHGSISCQAGSQFRCSYGDWVPLDVACSFPPPAPTITNPDACSCSEAELTLCVESGQHCCISLEAGMCKKKCCAER
jgi:hypothetical protein